MLLVPTLVLRVALAVTAPEVPAPPGEPRLEWIAPPQCPDAASGAEHLERFLGGHKLPAPARVELVASAAGYVAKVTVDGATRTLHAEDCETLARAAALVVAVSLDPVATAATVLRERDVGAVEEPGGSGAGSRGASSDTSTAPESDDTELGPTQEPARRQRTISTRADMPSRAEPGDTPSGSAHWLGASGGIALAIVPSLTGAVRLGYAYQRGPLRVQAEATYATPRAITYPAEPAVGGRFQSVVVGVRACFAPAAGRLAVPLCGGLEGGAIFGRGIGIPNARNPVGAWIGGLAGAAAVVRVHPRVALLAGADLLVGLRRPAFHVGARETLFRASPVGLRALAGLELRLR